MTRSERIDLAIRALVSARESLAQYDAACVTSKGKPTVGYNVVQHDGRASIIRRLVMAREELIEVIKDLCE